MTKPTGRPRGRPKTKDYVTLMARVPQDLADRVQRYAGLHQQTISLVLRDGLELLLEEDRSRPCMSDTKVGKIIVSDTKVVQTSLVPGVREESPLQASPRKTTQSTLRSEAPAARAAIQPDIKEDHSALEPARSEAPSSQRSHSTTRRPARRSEAPAAHPAITSNIPEASSALERARPAPPPASRRSATPRKTRPVPVPSPQLLDPEPDEKDSVEWRRWAVLAQVRTASVPCTPGDIAKQVASTSALVRGDLDYWCKQGRISRHEQGGYVAQ